MDEYPPPGPDQHNPSYYEDENGHIPETLFAKKERMDANIFQDVIDPSDVVHIQLLQILRDCKCPLYTYDKIMTWAAYSNHSGHVFDLAFKKRDQVMTEFIKKFEMDRVYPVTLPVKLYPDNQVANVVVPDIVPSIFSLLTDTELMQSENLVFPDEDDPFAPPSPNGYTHYEDVPTGKSWVDLALLYVVSSIPIPPSPLLCVIHSMDRSMVP